jgi:hypothetical protein
MRQRWQEGGLLPESLNTTTGADQQGKPMSDCSGNVAGGPEVAAMSRICRRQAPGKPRIYLTLM